MVLKNQEEKLKSRVRRTRPVKRKVSRLRNKGKDNLLLKQTVYLIKKDGKAVKLSPKSIQDKLPYSWLSKYGNIHVVEYPFSKDVTASYKEKIPLEDVFGERNSPFEVEHTNPFEDFFSEIAWIKNGMSYKFFEIFKEHFELTIADISKATNISPKTIDRRKEKGSFAQEETEKILRIAKVFSKSCQVFLNKKDAREWMFKENIMLGGISPITLCDTGPGCQEIIDMLGRIEHGIPQ